MSCMLIQYRMAGSSPRNRCRMCGASSYRHVIDRDGTGAMRATGLYRCSGCSVVFADPRAWRDGDDEQDFGPAQTSSDGLPASADADASRLAGAASAPPPAAPDWRTYGATPGPASPPPPTAP
jgi:hypothetical protein